MKDMPSNNSPEISSPNWFGISGLWQQANDMIDSQRLERLKQCQKLEDTLKKCRKGDRDREQLEDYPEGIRMTRYFDFRNQSSENCQREVHAVWACRAISLSCGTELVELRRCFIQNTGEMLTHKETAYESRGNKGASEDFPCKEFQQKVGSCIAKAASELERRRIKSSKDDTD